VQEVLSWAKARWYWLIEVYSNKSAGLY